MYSPRLGRFLQRDPEDYIDGANLYQYVVSSPTGFLDPDGTDPQYGTWSGINSYGHIYINKWSLPFTPTESLSDMSNLTTLSTGPWPFAVGHLNHEARNAPDPLPNFCPGPMKIEILMISAATAAGSPADPCGCCKVHATLLFNPGDNALAIAGIANDLSDRQKQMKGWGEAIPVDIPGSGIIGHVPNTLGPFPIVARVEIPSPDNKPWHAGVRYRETHKNFDPRGTDWFMNPQVQNADYAFVCHSQGCNMLLDALQKSCKKS